MSFEIKCGTVMGIESARYVQNVGNGVSIGKRIKMKNGRLLVVVALAVKEPDVKVDVNKILRKMGWRYSKPRKKAAKKGRAR